MAVPGGWAVSYERGTHVRHIPVGRIPDSSHFIQKKRSLGGQVRPAGYFRERIARHESVWEKRHLALGTGPPVEHRSSRACARKEVLYVSHIGIFSSRELVGEAALSAERAAFPDEEVAAALLVVFLLPGGGGGYYRSITA